MSAAGHDRKLFIQSLVAPPEICKEYEDEGFPCFEDPSRAVATMAALMHFGTAFDAGRAPTPAVAQLPPLPDGAIGEKEAKAILAEFGVPVPRGIAAFSVNDAMAAAAKLGGPIWVVKAQIHAGGRGKGGGVKVEKSESDVRREAERMLGMFERNPALTD